MPKMKTNKSIAKRFKITGTGKVRRNKQGRRHLLSVKSAKRKRNMRQHALVEDATQKEYKRLIGS